MTENNTYKLRDFIEQDCTGMLEWMHDPQVNYWYTDSIRKATPESVRRFIFQAAELKERGITYHYAIAGGDNEYIGTISLKNIDKIEGAEYAISMRKGFRGKGIASWATKEILQIAFQELGLNRVYLNVLSDNVHAIRFYEKNNFRYEGESKNCIQVGGQLKSLKWYAMLAEEYRQKEK